MMTPPVQPSSVRELVLDRLTAPAVFRGMIEDWSCRNWTLEQWADKLDRKSLRFRQEPDNVTSVSPLWEGECRYTSATLGDFVRWQKEECCPSSPPVAFHDNKWAYADYIHLAQLFESDGDSDVLQSVDWSAFGFDGRGGAKSTLWVGSRRAHTPCHYDTYGCNLVAQLIGRKRWVLFPPYDTDNLYPTRIPYEESSVFSQVDVGNPQLDSFPRLQLSKPHVVTLEPGDVLFVPHKWWHYVHSLSTSLSINSWIELDVDDERRLEESVTRTIVTAHMCPCGQGHHDQHKKWINPTEEYTSGETNVNYVSRMLDIVQQRQLSNSEKLAPRDVTRLPQESPEEPPENVTKRKSSHCDDSVGKKICLESELLDNRIELVRRSTFEQFVKSTDDTKRSWSPPKINEEHGEDDFRIRLCNAISHPDVVKLICEKLKETSSSSSTLL